MPKRKLEDELEEDWVDPEVKPVIKKNSLDSDEEDEIDEKKYEIMDDDDIEGQEDGAGGFDGEVHITPFNMKEELEEGHFDTEGNYHWKKDGKMVRDNWLENIDWVQIKQPDGKTPEGTGGDDDSDSGESSVDSPFDHIAVYRQMLELIKPRETVAKAIRRLGGSKTLSVSERWRRKKAGQDDSSDGNQQQVIELTAMANRVLTKMGNMDIYQESYEHIANLIDMADRKALPPPRPATSYGDALDMYSDDFDVKEKARLGEPAQGAKHSLEAAGSGGSAIKRLKMERGDRGSDGETVIAGARNMEDGSERQKVHWGGANHEEGSKSVEANVVDPDSEVMWEFKWQKESGEVHGPHSTSQMQAWVDSGYFKKSVWVRKVGQAGPFYTSQRVDFELYL